MKTNELDHIYMYILVTGTISIYLDSFFKMSDRIENHQTQRMYQRHNNMIKDQKTTKSPISHRCC